jgi:cytoskeletal protein RodZ
MTLFLIGLGIFVLVSAYFFFSDYSILFKKTTEPVSSPVVEPIVKSKTVKLPSKGIKAKSTTETKNKIKSVSSSKVTKPKVTKKEKVKTVAPEVVKSKRGRKKKS